MIERELTSKVESMMGSGKAIVILGARQVGKSTLLHSLFDDKDNVLWLSGDEPDIVALFENITSDRLKSLIGLAKYVIIDEAQYIPQVGSKLKLITDYIKDVQLVVTGSSSFDLSDKLNEPLTGRKRELKMFPVTFSEMVNHTNLIQEKRMIPHRMLYGYYPEVVNTPGQEKSVLRELSSSYLYKDLLRLDGISKPNKLILLLQALSHQVGQQISYNEIGNLIGLDSKTVEKYIDILEKSFIVFRLGSFARNARNELKFSKKIYFWDMGMRNAIIGNFSQMEFRDNVGALWENFVIAERMKSLAYNNSFTNSWFWRTQQQNEVDLIEEEDGIMRAYEFKWNSRKLNVKAPISFSKSYPSASFTVISPDNVEDFLL